MLYIYFFFISGDIAKSHWKKLRDSHREALKRQTSKSGQARGSSNKWKFQEQMSFVLNFTVNRRTESNISHNSPETDMPVDAVDAVEGSSCDNSSHSVSTPPTKRSSKDREIIDILMSNKKQREDRSAARDVLRQETSKNPGLYNFFLTMYETTATFPTHMQMRAKREVFDVISRFEEEVFASENSFSETPAISHESDDDTSHDFLNSYLQFTKK